MRAGRLRQDMAFRRNSPSAYLLTARILVRRGFMVPAEASARKALEFNPRMPLAHELLGEIEIARSDIPQAIKEFQSERALDPLHARQSTHGWATLISRDQDFRSGQGTRSIAPALYPNVTCTLHPAWESADEHNKTR